MNIKVASGKTQFNKEVCKQSLFKYEYRIPKYVKLERPWKWLRTEVFKLKVASLALSKKPQDDIAFSFKKTS